MKRSMKIVMSLVAILAIALTFAVMNLAPAEGVLGMLIAAPIVLASFETSADAKQMRADIWETMQAMVAKRKDEKRAFTEAEDKKYNELRRDFDALTDHVAALEKDEKRALTMAGKAIRDQANVSTPVEQWYDQRTAKPVMVLSRDQKITDQVNDGKRLSLGKAVRSLITGDWSNAPEERSALSTSSGSGLLVPLNVFASVLDLARAKSICFQAGAKFLTMDTGKMTMARVSEDPQMQVKAQNAAFDGTNIVFDAIEFNAHTIGSVCVLSRELAQDAPNVGSAIENAMAAALAQYIDQLMLTGTGTAQPKGLENLTHIHQVDAESGPLSYGHLLKAWQLIASSNFDPKTIALNPLEAAALTSLHSPYVGFINPPDKLAAMQWLTSNAVRHLTGTSIGFMGDFSQLFFGVASNSLIEISTAGDYFDKHQVGVKITLRGDCAAANDKAFAVIEDITTGDSWETISFELPAAPG